jgi:hypothetical protein
MERSLRAFAITCAAICCATIVALAPGCRMHGKAGSEVLESGATRRRVALRLFQKVVGRDASPDEVNALAAAGSYEAMVDKLLASGQYQTEGYFHFQHERLVLHRAGSETFQRRALADWCALQLELTDVARVEAESGYARLLDYREHFLEVMDVNALSCLFGDLTASDFVRAAEELSDSQGPSGEEPSFDPQVASAPSSQGVASQCAAMAQAALAAPFSEPDVDPNAFFKQKLQELKAAGDEPLGSTVIGEQLMLNAAGFNLVQQPRVEGDDLAPQIRAAYAARLETFGKLRLARRGGRALVAVSSLPRGDGLCRFTVVPDDKLSFIPPQGPLEGLDTSNATSSETFGTSTVTSIVPFATASSVSASLVDEGISTAGTRSAAVQDAFPIAASLGGAPLQIQVATETTPLSGPGHILVEMPDDLAGVHATPYWLTRHPSSKKNKQLHRARLIFHSYFCRDVNPDMANASGGSVNVPADLKPYFAPDDTHAFGAQSCFDCHAHVQPLANFFGKLSHGGDYNDPSGPAATWLAGSFGFDRPGGFRRDTDFFPVPGAKNRGTLGLAALIASHPDAHRCFVQRTWQTLAGAEAYLPPTEKDDAVQVLTRERGSQRSLLRHLLVQSTSGRMLFEQSQLPKPPRAGPCAEGSTLATVSPAATTTLESRCKPCHARGDTAFLQRSGSAPSFTYRLKAESLGLAVEGLPAAEKAKAIVERLHTMSCQIESGDMPLGGSLEERQKTELLCYTKLRRDKEASAWPELAGFVGKACDTAASADALLESAPHPVP